MKRFQKLFNKRGATAVEYGLIIAAIAIAILLVVTLLGDSIAGLFQQVVDSINGTA